MKKVSVIFAMLAMVFAISFTACRNTGTEATEEATEEAAPAEEATEQAAPEGQVAPAAEEGTDAAAESTEQ